MVGESLVARLPVDPVIMLAASLGLAMLLLGAAAHKLRRPGEFAGVLVAYGLLPRPLIASAGWLIPLTEAVLGLGLCASATRQAAASGVATLLFGYAVAMTLVLARGSRLGDCGCGFSHQRQPVSWALVWRNLLLALLAGNLTREAAERSLGIYDWSLIVLIALAGTALYAVANSLIATHEYTQELRLD